MSAKRVSIGTRPTAQTVPAEAEAWVKRRGVSVAEPMKRLTIDVPASLHRSIKAQCAMRGTKIADEIRDLLLQKYGKS